MRSTNPLSDEEKPSTPIPPAPTDEEEKPTKRDDDSQWCAGGGGAREQLLWARWRASLCTGAPSKQWLAICWPGAGLFQGGLWVFS